MFYINYQVRQTYAYKMVQALPKPMMTYYQLDVKEQILVFFIIKLTISSKNTFQIASKFGLIQVSMCSDSATDVERTTWQTIDKHHLVTNQGQSKS